MTEDVGLEALDLLPPAEVAERLRCSVRMVRRLVLRGELEQVKLGSRARITPESLAAYKQRLRDQAAKAS